MVSTDSKKVLDSNSSQLGLYVWSLHVVQVLQLPPTAVHDMLGRFTGDWPYPASRPVVTEDE